MGWALHTKHMRRIVDGDVVKGEEMKQGWGGNTRLAVSGNGACSPRQDEIR